MEIIEAFATQNKCYKIGSTFTPSGLMLHSVGCPQPSAAVFARNFNQYQPGGQSVCVHAFIQADGSVYQTLPWWMRAWHCGGAANNTHIGIEMTEPSSGMSYAEAAEQISGTYHTAVELFAQLCNTYGLNPLADGVIIGHVEGYRRGVASNHADPELLWNTYGMGYTMDGFRQDVYEAMNKNNGNDEEEEDVMRYNTIDEIPSWARGTISEMIDEGLISGTGEGNLDLSADMLRMLYVMKHMVDACNKHYETIEDIPSWARDTVQHLIDIGAIAGTGNGKLDISYDMLRMLVVCQRMFDSNHSTDNKED
jgi:hypothetical protein